MNTTKEVNVIIYEDFSFKEFLATLCLEMKPNAKTEEVKRAIDNACYYMEVINWKKFDLMLEVL